MEINELVFHNKLRDLQRQLSKKYFRLIIPRPSDYDTDKWLEEYKEFAESVHEEMDKLNEILNLVQPSSLESVLSLFIHLYGDEMIDMINAKNRSFPPPCPPMYGRTVKKPDLKAESTAVEQP